MKRFWILFTLTSICRASWAGWIGRQLRGDGQDAELLPQALAALRAVHSAGFLHGDVRLPNFMVEGGHEAEGQVRVRDGAHAGDDARVGDNANHTGMAGDASAALLPLARTQPANRQDVQARSCARASPPAPAGARVGRLPGSTPSVRTITFLPRRIRAPGVGPLSSACGARLVARI